MKSILPSSSQSHQNCSRFNNRASAKRYPSKFRCKHFRDFLEKKAIRASLKHVTKKSHILDIPCGTGRLIKILEDAELNVSAADLSIEMLNRAKLNYQNSKNAKTDDCDVQFFHEDIINTKFKDCEFDNLICHRLFHHLVDRETRIKAINEVKRISKDTIIISFLSSGTLSAYWKNIKNLMRRKKSIDRIRFSLCTFQEELESSSLEVVEVIPVLKNILSLHLVVVRKNV